MVTTRRMSRRASEHSIQASLSPEERTDHPSSTPDTTTQNRLPPEPLASNENTSPSELHISQVSETEGQTGTTREENPDIQVERLEIEEREGGDKEAEKEEIEESENESEKEEEEEENQDEEHSETGKEEDEHHQSDEGHESDHDMKVDPSPTTRVFQEEIAALHRRYSLDDAIEAGLLASSTPLPSGSEPASPKSPDAADSPDSPKSVSSRSKSPTPNPLEAEMATSRTQMPRPGETELPPLRGRETDTAIRMVHVPKPAPAPQAFINRSFYQFDPDKVTWIEYRCGSTNFDDGTACDAITRLRRPDQMRCRTCGGRVLFKVRTKRMVQFEAR